jgi:hypothetical protein
MHLMLKLATLSGGMSFFYPRYVFACDNVLEYEIVMVNGDQAIADRTQKL